MAVEEAAVQLLRHGNGSPLVLNATIAEDELHVELSTNTATHETVFDPSSFSWMILQALTDRLSTAVEGDTATLRLVKCRQPADRPDDASQSKGQG
jgi:hypothetical protein